MNKAGRPKGSKQARNESKYWLPEGVKLKDGQGQDYLKSTKLMFIDNVYGEFIGSFYAIQNANASTHPTAVSARRQATNMIKFGGPNPSNSPEVRRKAEKTMLEKYGAEHALLNPDLLKKSQATLLKSHGVTNMTDSPEIRNKIKKTNLARFGSENAMGNVLVQMKQFYSAVESGNQFCSSGEKEVKEFVQSFGFTCKSKFIFEGKVKRQLDIYIEELNLAIEYNGLYWHSEANEKIYPKYHLDKLEMCKKQGIRLIQIFEHEWLDRKEQVKSFLQSALNKNTTVIFARKCEIREVQKYEAKRFLDSYHIQGAPMFNSALGLYSNNELVALASFGKHHRNGSEWVLSRFVGKTGINVVGGLSRLVKHGLEKYGELSTWVDLRWSTGENWIKCGWELKNVLPPDYFYFDNKTGDVISKQSRQKKNVNTPEGMTEHEHSLSEKLYRLYDCGKLKLTTKSK